MSAGGLRGFKALLHEGGVRVPLIVRWPGHTRAGSFSNVPVIGTDFYPTFLEARGLPAMAEEHLDGVSFVPLLAGKSDTLSREAL